MSSWCLANKIWSIDPENQTKTWTKSYNNHRISIAVFCLQTLLCLLVIFADQVFIDPPFLGIFVYGPLHSFTVLCIPYATGRQKEEEGKRLLSTPWIPDSRSVLDNSFCQWNLDSSFHSVVRFQIRWAVVRIPKAKFSRIPESGFSYIGRRYGYRAFEKMNNKLKAVQTQILHV